MSHSSLVENLFSLWWIILAAMLAPICALITRRYIPDVIWLLIFGIIISPYMLGLSKFTESIEILRELGMGFLFLLAGFEVNTSDMRNKQGRHALITWIICFLLAISIGLLFTSGDIHVSVVVAIATTSTALGTLLPILKDSGMMNLDLGKATITHGAYGELLPIVAMSLLLSTFATWQASIILIVFSIISFMIVMIPIRFIRKTPLLGKAILTASNTTMQTTLRITVFILVTLMLLTAVLKLDIALGAFLAGILLNVILKSFSPKQGEEIAHKVEIVGFSFLIPIFFITSGMSINLLNVLENWQLVLYILAFIAIIRGFVVYLRERFTNTFSNLSNSKEKIALGLYSATGLPIIVAVTEIAESSDIIKPDTSAVMITGGALTVLLFPLIANLILKQKN
ncbi:cation:proton antiporter [Staphylococcus equorum]|uniref:cation:proton antiporter n=1 Tax=Staphylococcus equorum TaxID=246432 RepID=UPI0039818F3D